MISNVLLEQPWLSPSGLAVLVVLGPFLGARLVSRRAWAWWLTAASLVPVALLTLVPDDRELFARCTVDWSLPTPGRVELMANLVLFVGPALFAGVASRRPLLALVCMSGLSVGIEALQAVATGLGRSCDTTDWLANTIGAVTGAALAVAALALSRRAGVAGATHGR